MENKDVYFNFLEELRQSGVTNMFGATPYLEAEFDELTHSEAVEILKEWMKNYSELSKRLGWDKELVDNETSEDSFEAYKGLFDETIESEHINEFLKELAEENKMSKLNDCKHIWFIDDVGFVSLYNNDIINIFVESDHIEIYEDLKAFCDDFAFTEAELIEKINAVTHLDLTVEDTEETVADDDSEDVVEYDSDAVVEDDFEEVE